MGLSQLAPVAPGGGAALTGKADPKVFEGPVATTAPDIFPKVAGPLLRVLTVDERAGLARRNSLVRVPLFFHKGECADPNALNIVPAGGGAPIPYQADDIRRDSSGKVARMHVYFYTDLPAWGRKQFGLVPGKNPVGTLLPVAEKDGKVSLSGEEIRVTFYSKGPLAGAISDVATRFGKVAIPNGSLAPSLRLTRQAENLEITRSNEVSYSSPDALQVQDLRWSSGPLFSKLQVKVAPKSAPTDVAEYVYVVPRHGCEIIQTQLLYPAERDKTTDTVGAQEISLLKGKVVIGDSVADQAIVNVPAGLRKELRSVFGYTNNAIVNAKAGLSLLMIPAVQMGATGIADEGAAMSFKGSATSQRTPDSNSGSLRVYWDQVRYIFSKAVTPEDLWKLSCENFLPLTAVVDEPGASPGALFAFAKQVNKEYGKIKYWTPSFEATVAMAYLGDKLGSAKSLMAKNPTNDELQVESNIPSKEAIEEAFTTKFQGAPPADPYTLTYSKSAIVPFSAYLGANSRLDRWSATLGQISRLANGRVTDYGWPFVRSFTNAANMHQGTYLMGIWGGRKTGNKDLVQWCWDATQNEALRGNYGHAQRPYSLDVGTMDQSDALYISITDFFLRLNELINNEDLSIHPSVYGRYHDAVDVNTDIYQHKLGAKSGVDPCPYRAMMFRLQQHDHRWESYGADPFLCMLGKASDAGKVGITEACYYTQSKVGRPATWNTLMTDTFLPSVAVGLAIPGYKPATRPPLPANLKIARANGNTLTWDEVPGAVGYRVYRADQDGGPWTWVNSPYAAMPAFEPPSRGHAHGDLKPAPIPDTLIKAKTYSDPTGRATTVYVVTAQDKDGRESRWFPNEPLPSPGVK